MGEDGFGQVTDALQGQALQGVMGRLDQMYEIIVGNGNPEKGLAAQVMLLKRDIAEVRQQQKESEIKRTEQITEVKQMIIEDRLARSKQYEKNSDRWVDTGVSLVRTLISAGIGALITLAISGKIHFQ